MNRSYSPFNKTYKYITLQNQLAHKTNIKLTKSLTYTNISLNESLKQTRPNTTSKTNATIRKQPLVIHKNSKFNQIQYQKIRSLNLKLSSKLKHTKCKVLKVEDLKRDYQEYSKYRSICERYDKERRCRKDLIIFPYASLISSRIKSSRQQLCTVDFEKIKKSDYQKLKQSRY